MTSSFGQNKAPKNNGFYAQEKCSPTTLTRYGLNSFTEDKIYAQRMPSPTSSVYSEARDSTTSFTCENECSGDSQNSPPSFLKNALILDKNFMRKILAKPNITTDKVIHIDIAPENECSENNIEHCNEDLRQNLESSNLLENTIFVGNKDCADILQDESSKEYHGTQVKRPDFLKTDRWENTCKEYHGTQVKRPDFLKTYRCENTCDIEKKVRWSPRVDKFEYFQRCSDDSCSFESFNEPVLNYEHSDVISKRKDSPNIPPWIRDENPSHIPAITVESSAQTDNPKRKIKKRSKFKMTLLQIFLSCARCCM